MNTSAYGLGTDTLNNNSQVSACGLGFTTCNLAVTSEVYNRRCETRRRGEVLGNTRIKRDSKLIDISNEI